MSHFTRLKTQIVEKEFLLQALKDLGYAWEQGELEVRAYGRQRAKVEIKVKLGGLLGREVGFIKKSGAYEMVADWYGSGNQQEQFVNHLMQRYAYHAARQKLEEQGFALVEEKNEQDGQIHLTLRRVA